MTTSADVLQFVLNSATEDDLSRIYEAAKQRTKSLRIVAAAQAATLAPGTAVRTDGLSPKYLNGLSGVLKSVRGSRATVTLDEESTNLLRWSGRGRFHIPGDIKYYDLGGLPLSTVKPA